MPNLKLAFYFDGDATPAVTANRTNPPKAARRNDDDAEKVVVSSTIMGPSTTTTHDPTASDPGRWNHIGTIFGGR